MQEEELSHKLNLLAAHIKRRRELELKKAQLGLSADPSIHTEIEDISKEIVSLEQSINDAERPLGLKITSERSQSGVNNAQPVSYCKHCNGDGRVPCRVCVGSGLIMKNNRERICNRCNGSGDIACPRCNGTAYILTEGTEYIFSVEGTNAAEVQKVVLALLKEAKDEAARKTSDDG